MKNTLTYRSLVAYIVSVVPTVRCNDCNEICDVAPCHCGSFCSYTDEETPITLEDILIAAFVSKIDLGIKVTDKTTVRLMHVTASMMSTKTDWLLSKPLSGQDKRTIIWLVSLFPISK